MKFNLALTILLITHAIAENDDAKDVVAEVEEKSAKEDDAKPVEEVNRDAESYTVPVEVVKDVVNESEVVKSADADGNKEDGRVERSTAQADGAPELLDETAKVDSDSEHIANRRASDDTTTAAIDDDNFEKSAGTDDALEKEAKPETEAVKDDEVLKTGEDGEQKDDLSVRSANVDTDVEDKSEADIRSSKPDDELKDLEKAADIQDVALMSENVDDLSNFNTRRMLFPLETVLDTKARLGEQEENSDEGSVRSGVENVVKSLENGIASDSHRPHESQTFLSPLMPVPNKQNFFLTPALPVDPARQRHARISTSPPTRRFSNNFPNNLPLNYLQTEPKPFPGYNHHQFQHPGSFPQLPLPLTTVRPQAPLVPPLPYSLPNYEEIYRKAVEDSKSQENFNQFQNNGYNRRVVAYVPSYLRYV